MCGRTAGQVKVSRIRFYHIFRARLREWAGMEKRTWAICMTCVSCLRKAGMAASIRSGTVVGCASVLAWRIACEVGKSHFELFACIYCAQKHILIYTSSPIHFRRTSKSMHDMRRIACRRNNAFLLVDARFRLCSIVS